MENQNNNSNAAASIVANSIIKPIFDEAAKTVIKECRNGYPCMFGEAVVRIIGESGEGSWGEINGKQYYSVPLVASPHGTIIKTGIFYLTEITEEGMGRLLAYEKELRANGEELYAGKLSESDLIQK